MNNTFRRRLLSCGDNTSYNDNTGPLLLYFTKSSKITIPSNVTRVDAFIVGGGGGGGRGSNKKSGRCGTGGNGGEVKHFYDIASAGKVLNITIGQGGVGGVNNTNGADSYITIDNNTYTARGGSKGVDTVKIFDSSWISSIQELQPIGNVGGMGSLYGGAGSVGNNGTPITSDWYDLLDPEYNGYYGASGGGGSDCFNYSAKTQISGGITGGGNGGYGTNNSTLNNGTDGTFFGAGGGGGGFNSSHVTGLGGAGYLGIVILYLS